MVKRRRKVRYVVPSKLEKDGTLTFRTYTVPYRVTESRRRHLLSAGYLAKEISKTDNTFEVGLLSLPLKVLKRLNVLQGRENHITHIIKAKEVKYAEARRIAVRDFEEWGGIVGRADDYITYYYERLYE